MTSYGSPGKFQIHQHYYDLERGIVFWPPLFKQLINDDSFIIIFFRISLSISKLFSSKNIILGISFSLVRI